MPKELFGDKLYTIREVAELFEVTTRTVELYVKDGKLKGQKIGGKRYFTEETLQAFVRGEQPRA